MPLAVYKSITLGFQMRKTSVCTIALLGGIFSIPTPASTAPIDVDFTYHFRSFRAENNVGITPGDRLTFGLAARPNPVGSDGGTTAIARQAGTTVELFDLESPAFANEFASSRPVSSGLTGSWEITLTNEEDTRKVSTPTVIDPDTKNIFPIVPQVSNVQISGNSGTLTPTFSWSVPSTFDDLTPRVVIYDRDDRVGDLARQIHQQSLTPGATSYTLPAVLDDDGSLIRNNGYSVNVRYELIKDGRIGSISNFFFDFTPVEREVFIPEVDPTGSPTGGPEYSFNISVSEGDQIFIDPEISIGYDYEIGAGDPNFRSVELPDIGDGLFDLWLRDSAGDIFDTGEDIFAGDEFLFSSLGYDGGVGFFRILGIEESAGLDPQDPTAFVTGLTFVGDGQFTGTMTPITTQVPLPSTLFLFVGGLASVLVTLRAKSET
jgi:hypothetical protein